MRRLARRAFDLAEHLILSARADFCAALDAAEANRPAPALWRSALARPRIVLARLAQAFGERCALAAHRGLVEALDAGDKAKAP